MFSFVTVPPGTILLCENVADVVWIPQTVAADGFTAAVSLTHLQAQWCLEHWLLTHTHTRTRAGADSRLTPSTNKQPLSMFFYTCPCDYNWSVLLCVTF